MKRIFVVLLLASVPAFTFSQISPATRPHTHAGASSGGSTLAITSLTVSESSPGSVVLQNTSGAAAGLQIQGSAGDQWRIQTGLLVQGDFGIRNASQAVNGLIFATGATPDATFIGRATSTKACAANFTRTGPNYCLCTNSACGSNNYSPSGTCISSIAAPSGAVAVMLSFQYDVHSTNTLNVLDSATMQWYNDASCTTPIGTQGLVVKEFVALVNTSIGQAFSTVVVPVVSGNIVIKPTFTANSTVSSLMIGYFD